MFNLSFHTIALSFDDDGFRMMEQTIQDCGGNGTVIVKDFRPMFKRTVGYEHDGAVLIAVTDNLKQQIGTGFIERQIAEFVNAQKGQFEILFHFEFEPSCALNGSEGINDIDGGGEQHAMPF